MSVFLAPPWSVQLRPDTLIALQPRSAVEVAADVAVIVMALSVAAVALWLLFFLRRRLGGIESAVRAASRQVADRAGPLVDRSRDVADNVEFITRALRSDVERLNASVRALGDRLQQASDRMEERIEEFNALIEVVQSEAESLFIDTASTVRGVTAGARSVGAGDRSAGSGAEAPPDETDADKSSGAHRRKEASGG